MPLRGILRFITACGYSTTEIPRLQCFLRDFMVNVLTGVYTGKFSVLHFSAAIIMFDFMDKVVYFKTKDFK